MSVKFKCVYTGNVFTFTHESDIADMRRHPEYVEVKEEEKKVEDKPVPAKKEK
jgi:hypothetical protein